MFHIKLKIPNKYDNFLNKIFENLNSNNCKWIIEDEEVLNKDGLVFFEKNSYTNEEFFQLINKDSYYLIFLNLQLYKNNSLITSIKNFSEFIKSNCELAMIIVDSEFVDLYIKEEKVYNILLSNIRKNKFEIYDLFNKITNIQ